MKQRTIVTSRGGVRLFLSLSGFVCAVGICGLVVEPVQAAPTPESCFAFDVATGSIMNYYNTQANSPSGPSCPRDVEIPRTIGGVPVVNINDPVTRLWPFTAKGLTSVIIPDTVQRIGSYAFYDNSLTSLVIPNSVTSIDTGAFSDNRLESVVLSDRLTQIKDETFSVNNLESVVIPDSVTVIGHKAFYGQSRTILPKNMFGMVNFYQAEQTVFYTRLYTVSPNNPNGLKDSAVYIREDFCDFGCDFNEDGDDADAYLAGGHLINSTPFVLNYIDESHTTLRPSTYLTGVLTNGSPLTSYAVKDSPDVPDVTILPSGSSYDPASVEAQQRALAVYFRRGSVVAWSAPAINGYIAPNPSSGTIQLGSPINTGGVNSLDLVYRDQRYAGVNNPPVSTKTLAETGDGVGRVIGLAGFLIGLGISGLARHRRLS